MTQAQNLPIRQTNKPSRQTASEKNQRKGKMAGVAGIEPANADTKNRCLTTWPHPSTLTVSSVSQPVTVSGTAHIARQSGKGRGQLREIAPLRKFPTIYGLMRAYDLGKSSAECRFGTFVPSSPHVRFTIFARFTAGRFITSLAHRFTASYSWIDRNFFASP